MKIELFKKMREAYSLHLDKYKWVTYLIELGIWALINYLLGNRFYAIFILIFFLTLTLSRAPSFTLIAVTALFIIYFNTPAIDTLIHLHQSNMRTSQNISSTLKLIFSPNTGQEVLPDQVQNMLSLLKTHQLVDYQISSALFSNQRTMQRITESAWPIKMTTSSSFHLITSDEMNKYSSCSVIDQKEDVALVYCH